MSSRLLSYAQRFEDLYLLRCFPDQPTGFYIDIGSGHPVYDNVSFAFYLRGWSGIAAEPNPRLAALTRSVRPRDQTYEGIVGAADGAVDFYLVDEFHGFSTSVAGNADAALEQFGKASEKISVPSISLAKLCEQSAPQAVEFLKVDVEGAEADVLRSGDWVRFKPKIVVVEALAPFTQAPAWNAFEPFLIECGYRYVWFDSLNRYYLAHEANDLAHHFAADPIQAQDVDLFRDAGRALEQKAHPDHHLAQLLATADLGNLPLHNRADLIAMLTAGLSPAELSRTVSRDDPRAICKRVFGRYCPAPDWLEQTLPKEATVRDLYAHLADSDLFRTACGRIAAGYAW